MNEEAIRSLLADAATHLTPPPDFDRPAEIVQGALAERRRLARRRIASGAAAALVVLGTGFSLLFAQPVRSALASIPGLRLFISIMPGSLEEYAQTAEGPPEGPPNDFWPSAKVGVEEALRRTPFLPPREVEGWRLVKEFAGHPAVMGEEGWELGSELYYDMTYEDEDGRQLYVTQRQISPEIDGIGHLPETRETTVAGYPAYIRTRTIRYYEDGRVEVWDGTAYLYVYLSLPNGDTQDTVELVFNSATVPPEDVISFAERFLDR